MKIEKNYLSPDITVVAINATQIICASQIESHQDEEFGVPEQN